MIEPHPLLELQRLDLEADQHRARRAALPERAASAACEAELAAVAHARGEADVRRAALRREEHQAEAVVADLEAKTRAVSARLYSGEVKAIKELEGLQLELRECQRRQGEQEAAEFALLEREEEVSGEIAALDARRDHLTAELAELRSALAAAEDEIDAELGRLLEARAGAVAQLDATLVARYERLRVGPAIRGRAAVRVAGDTCGGCRSALPIAFAAGLQGEPAGTTVPCPRCGRILVL